MARSPWKTSRLPVAAARRRWTGGCAGCSRCRRPSSWCGHASTVRQTCWPTPRFRWPRSPSGAGSTISRRSAVRSRDSQARPRPASADDRYADRVTDDSLLQSPLHDRHVALGAKFAEFGGWSMPLHYTGVVDEHTAVRERVGVFDVSHLGKATVRGPGARALVDSCLTNDLGKIEPGQAQYTMCCDESGGVIDDLILYLRSDDDLFLVPNAANTAGVVDRLRAAAPAVVEVLDAHRDYAVLAVQGPRSDDTFSAAGLPVDHPFMSFVDSQLADVPAVVFRSGYTGERGYEDRKSTRLNSSHVAISYAVFCLNKKNTLHDPKSAAT